MNASIQRRVYRTPKAGSIADLKLQSETLPPPGEGEVQVEVKAIGLNFADIFALQGLYKATPKGSFIPGLEFSGTIKAVGADVTAHQPGDRVMGVSRFGAYVTHLNIDQRYAIPLPEQWSFEEGAGFLVQGLTAYYALTELGGLKKGMTVLIHSAAGGVGLMANRICKSLGAYIIGTVGNESKKAFLLKEEGYDAVIVRDRRFRQKLDEALGGRPLHIVMECIGGRIFRESWAAMAPMGRLIAYGSASFTSQGARPNYPKLIWQWLQRPKVDPLRLPSQNKSLMGFNLIFLYEQTELMYQMLAELQALHIRPQHVGATFPFEELHSALALFQSGTTVGKVVVMV